MKISFSGIYDIRFPAGVKPEVIDQKAEKAKEFFEVNFPGNEGMYDVRILDYFNITKTDKPVTDKGIRISTTFDNPWILCSLFEHIDKRLGQEYVDKSKVELLLDTKA